MYNCATAACVRVCSPSQRRELFAGASLPALQPGYRTVAEAAEGAGEVTASLQRTKALMAQQIEQTSATMAVLGELRVLGPGAVRHKGWGLREVASRGSPPYVAYNQRSLAWRSQWLTAVCAVPALRPHAHRQQQCHPGRCEGRVHRP